MKPLRQILKWVVFLQPENYGHPTLKDADSLQQRRSVLVGIALIFAGHTLTNLLERLK